MQAAEKCTLSNLLDHTLPRVPGSLAVESEDLEGSGAS